MEYGSGEPGFTLINVGATLTDATLTLSCFNLQHKICFYTFAGSRTCFMALPRFPCCPQWGQLLFYGVAWFFEILHLITS
jgi:hypothetical protein